MSDTLSLRRKKIFSNEVIDFQKDDFGVNIETLVDGIDTLIKDAFSKDANIKEVDVNKQIRNSKQLKDLKKLIFDRLGMKVNFIIESHVGAILPFYPNVNHIFLNNTGSSPILEEQRELLKKLDKKGSNIGFVNTKTAKLGGIFSEYENQLYINFLTLVKVYELSPTEITAVMLHELGHGFYACEFSDRLESTNQVLLDVAKKITSDDNEKHLNYVYKELTKLDDTLTTKDAADLLKNNRIIPGYNWFKLMIKVTKSQLLLSKYDQTSFEQLADNFASRFGYGGQLAIALNKVGKDTNSILIFVEIITIYHTFKSLLILFMFPNLITLLLSILFYTTILYFFGESFKDYTYDKLEIRYRRIRNDLVASLKTSELDNTNMKRIVATLKEIDNIILNTKEYKFLYNKISNILFSQHNKVISNIEEQQLLENLASNDLFIKAAQLRTINQPV